MSDALANHWRELKAILVKAHPEDSAWEPATSHLAGKIDAALSASAVCAVCNGAGVVGTPGAKCPFCKMHTLGNEYVALSAPASPLQQENTDVRTSPADEMHSAQHAGVHRVQTGDHGATEETPYRETAWTRERTAHAALVRGEALTASSPLQEPADERAELRPMPGTMGWDWLMWFASEMHRTPTASLAEIMSRLGYVSTPVRQETAEPARWIAVAERLPEQRVQVLIWRTSRWANVLQDSLDHDETDGLFWSECGELAVGESVTHWMPLPAAPEAA